MEDIAQKEAKYFLNIFPENLLEYESLVGLEIKDKKINLTNRTKEIQRENVFYRALMLTGIDNFKCITGFGDNYPTDMGILTFSKNKYRKNVLVPDVYALNNYNGMLNIKDTFEKKDGIIFAGSSTGNTFNLFLNERLKVCNYAIDKDWLNCKITNIVQTNYNTVKQCYSECDNFISKFIPVDEQLKYKFILSIDGNTTAWDRVPWVMNSRSLLFRYTTDNMNWYYPLMKEGTHFVECDLNNIESKYMYYLNNPKEVEFIVNNANQFVRDYLTFDKQLEYLKLVLQFCK
jgi:hypothetical protein